MYNKILVTGGAGYIGSVLVPHLLKLHNEVHVVDNFMYGQAPFLHCCYYPSLHIHNRDVCDGIEDLLDDVDVIIPLAALVGQPVCDKYAARAKDVILSSIDDMIPHLSDNQLVIYPTTDSGYGSTDGNVMCTEETPLNPVSWYAKLKMWAADTLLENHGNTIIFRLATAFGVSPRMRFDLLVNDFTQRAVRDGAIVLFESHYKRNFVHVSDIAGAMIFAMDNSEFMKGEIYNVGLDDANISKMELCEIIKEVVPGFTVVESNTGTDPDQRNYIVSNEKLAREGFRAIIPLVNGIKEVVRACGMLTRQHSNV
jgi:nucleoside-diphosphate-sugar epimerase